LTRQNEKTLFFAVVSVASAATQPQNQHFVYARHHSPSGAAASSDGRSAAVH